MGQYVMFCYSQGIGGGQNYVNSRVKNLQDNGWKPLVFTAGTDPDGEIPWEFLKDFKKMVSPCFKTYPENFSKHQVNLVLDWMESFVDKNNEPIIIESHTDYFAEWGERLAKRLQAKHICFLLDERLEEYKSKEFLYYKFERKEVAGIHPTSMQRLFRGYREVPEDESRVLTATHYDNVVDYYCESVEKISDDYDWNIAYFGRNKAYVNEIVSGIFNFAKEHGDKKIQFIVISQIGSIQQQIPRNIKILELGFFNPIPSSLFRKLDVVIAGAGCAVIAAYAGVYTIVADAESFLANGVFGYTLTLTNFNEVLFSNKNCEKYENVLNDILVDKKFENQKIELPALSKVADDWFKEIDTFIASSDQSKEYYNFALGQHVIPLSNRIRSEIVDRLFKPYLHSGDGSTKKQMEIYIDCQNQYWKYRKECYTQPEAERKMMDNIVKAGKKCGKSSYFYRLRRKYLVIKYNMKPK